jgi:hypothetical protein
LAQPTLLVVVVLLLLLLLRIMFRLVVGIAERDGRALARRRERPARAAVVPDKAIRIARRAERAFNRSPGPRRAYGGRGGGR